MAHHQGMAFQSLAHVLLNAPMTERFMSSTAFRSASLLLQERVPDAVDLYSPRRHFESHEGRVKPVTYEPRIFAGADTPVPEIQLLSNSHYHLMLTAGGGGYSRWNNIALTRWRSDTTRDNWGRFAISVIRKQERYGVIPGIQRVKKLMVAMKRSLPMQALNTNVHSVF